MPGDKCGRALPGRAFDCLAASPPSAAPPLRPPPTPTWVSTPMDSATALTSSFDVTSSSPTLLRAPLASVSAYARRAVPLCVATNARCSPRFSQSVASAQAAPTPTTSAPKGVSCTAWRYAARASSAATSAHANWAGSCPSASATASRA